MRVRDWERFQHYKNRSPKWIKLYREEILNSHAINQLNDKEFRVFILLLLVASEDPDMMGQLPAIEQVAFRTHISEQNIEKCVPGLSRWLEQDDSDLLAGCEQDECLEESREEKRREEERRETRLRASAPVDVDWVFTEWNEIAVECGLPQCLKITQARRKVARSRLRDNSEAELRLVLTAPRRSSFLRGEKGGRDWTADLDWLMRPANFVKVLEGKYDDKTNKRDQFGWDGED